MNGLDALFPGLAGTPNIHPIFVHFPAALLPVALLLQVLAMWTRREAWSGHARACLYLGTLGALAAVTTGYMAANGLGHDSPGHDLVHVHRNIVLVATLLALVTSGAALILAKRAPLRDRVVLCGLLATVAVLSAGADRGANMVYRYGIAVANEPPPTSPGYHDGGHHHGAADAHAAPDEATAPAHDEHHETTMGAEAGHDHDAHEHGATGMETMETAPPADASPEPDASLSETTAPAPAADAHDHAEHMHEH